MFKIPTGGNMLTHEFVSIERDDDGALTLSIDSGYTPTRDALAVDIRLGETEYRKDDPTDYVTLYPDAAREIAAALIHVANEIEARR